mmetsp:Transcript_8878/g.29206  ORF Transcript_8878/g.29206 Transcript_8878/m.29206 type:complete len:139 (-) Transcript_8878:183-599(-)
MPAPNRAAAPTNRATSFELVDTFDVSASSSVAAASVVAARSRRQRLMPRLLLLPLACATAALSPPAIRAEGGRLVLTLGVDAAPAAEGVRVRAPELCGACATRALAKPIAAISPVLHSRNRDDLKSRTILNFIERWGR